MKKCKWQVSIGYNKKNGGKCTLGVTFSYVGTIYQMQTHHVSITFFFD
jgi:hypothetical protein